MGLLWTLIAQRRLLVELVRRDVRARFAGARFGLLWSLINPAVQLAAYGLIFSHVYTDPTRPRGAVTASLFCGLWPWWAFQEGVTRGTAALVEQAGLLRKLPMPAALVIVASSIASVAVQMLGFLIFLAVFAVLGVVEPQLAWLALPALVVAQLALVIGVGLVLSPLYLVARDVMYVVNLCVTIGFFLSPVLYQLEDLPPRLRGYAMANPLTGLLGAFRSLVLGGACPPWGTFGVLVATTALLWHCGIVLVQRIEGRIDEFC